MPDFVHYQVVQKNPEWGAAITRGFGAKVGRLDRPLLGRGYVHIVAGLQFGALEILKAVRAAGEPYIFADRAYFGGGAKSGRMRMTFGGYQQSWIVPGPRADRGWGVTLASWRAGGEFVMVVPPTAQVQSLFGIDWERDWMPKVRAATERPLVISPKSDRDKSPLARRLAGCHCVVTWTSNVAVEAVVAGVPAYVCSAAAAAPVAGRLEAIESDGVESLRRPVRAPWLESLGWGQFTVSEIAQGYAREVLMENLKCAA